jgi:hypothetical protein
MGRMKHRPMHVLFAVMALALALPAAAQSPADRPLPSQQMPAKSPPPKAAPAKGPTLQPIPEPPPPPPGFEPDPALEPQVTIQRRGTETVEEFRIQGRLYMIKVTPAHGVPYYLVDDVGRGDFVRRDNYDARTRPPMWVIHTF